MYIFNPKLLVYSDIIDYTQWTPLAWRKLKTRGDFYCLNTNSVETPNQSSIFIETREQFLLYESLGFFKDFLKRK